MGKHGLQAPASSLCSREPWACQMNVLSKCYSIKKLPNRYHVQVKRCNTMQASYYIINPIYIYIFIYNHIHTHIYIYIYTHKYSPYAQASQAVQLSEFQYTLQSSDPSVIPQHPRGHWRERRMKHLGSHPDSWGWWDGLSQMLHVWNIYLHLPQKWHKCR